MNNSNSSVPEDINKIAKDAVKYWSSSQNSLNHQDLSHWRGKGRWENDSEWLEIGRDNFRMFEEFARQEKFKRPLKNMIEWGPGGGSNALAFAPEVEKYYGIDISPANLRECSEQMKKAGYGDKFIPIHFDSPHPEQVLQKIPPEQCDFFLCTSVFQHMPGKEYAVKVLKTAYYLLKQNGLAIIQIRFDDGREKSTSHNSDYQKNALHFTSFYLPEFWYINQKLIKLNPKRIELKLQASYAYFFLKKI
jgi:cyclopropane fatty-acyl-phospholipid synthase-like methyltransferase